MKKQEVLEKYNKKVEAYNTLYARFCVLSQGSPDGKVTNDIALEEINDLVKKYNTASSEYLAARAAWIEYYSKKMKKGETTDGIILDAKTLDADDFKPFDPNVSDTNDVDCMSDDKEDVLDILRSGKINKDVLVKDIKDKTDVKKLKDRLNIEFDSASELKAICDELNITDSLGLETKDFRNITSGLDVQNTLSGAMNDISGTFSNINDSLGNIEWKREISKAMGDFDIDIPKMPSLPTLPGTMSIASIITIALKKAEVELKKMLAEKAKELFMEQMNKLIPKQLTEFANKAKEVKNDVSGKITNTIDKAKREINDKTKSLSLNEQKKSLEDKVKSEANKIGERNTKEIQKAKDALKQVNEVIDEANKLDQINLENEKRKLEEQLKKEKSETDVWKEYLEKRKKKYGK